MKYHAEALPRKMRAAWDTLAACDPLKDFYLAGGTALALRLGHRESIDLDFFSASNTLGLEERRHLISVLESLNGFELEEEKERTVHALLTGVSLSFFHYPYRLLSPTASYEGITIAGLEDIGVMKLTALAGRGSKKDFIDLYVLAKTTPLAQLLESCAKKIQTYRDFRIQALKAMVYFADAESEPMPRMHIELTWDQVKEFFKSQARILMRNA